MFRKDGGGPPTGHTPDTGDIPGREDAPGDGVATLWTGEDVRVDLQRSTPPAYGRNGVVDVGEHSGCQKRRLSS